MDYEKRKETVNKCLNWFADTVNVDYVDGLPASDVQREYSECKEMADTDFKELRIFFR